LTGSKHSQSGSLLTFPRHLLGRLYLLAAILSLDCLLIAFVPHSVPLLGPFAPFGIVSAAVFVGLGYSRIKLQRDDLRFGWWFFAIHIVCVIAISLVDLAALNGHTYAIFSDAPYIALRAILLIGIALLALACVPLRTWVEIVRLTKPSWLYAILAGTLAWCLRYPFQSMWDASSSAPGRLLQIATFHSVQAIMRFFVSNVVVDAPNFIIGTPNFSVFIAEACSGMEGLGLVLVFTIVWLWYFRRESRFPQALLLIPIALVSVWMLNILRIAALICIGDAGAEDVAMVGFHSQAGWIAFTAVAFAFSMATRKLSWVRRVPAGAGPAARQVDEIDEAGESPATAAYLAPFLAILAASFISKAVSAYFEWLYPLRFIAALVAIWCYRREYRKLNWSFNWLAPVSGASVFLLWIAPALWSHSSQPGLSGEVGPALAALPPAARFTWIAIRIAAAVITVPIAEELAFRGYVARRLIDREFDTVDFSALTLLSIGISSVAFGLMHGQHWFVGILAGLVYAFVLKRRGRFGDAVVAHATSNLLLAAWVLMRGDWAQW
jgi:exosortase E/protease (VPEID-CTERM system)